MDAGKIIIVVSFLWFAVSFWNRNELPRDLEIIPALAEEPLQKKTREASFTTRYNDIDYEIEPEYDYELHGMVVSFRLHDGESTMHFRSSDHLNMIDVCVVWGDNADNPVLHEMEFWNGIFTCAFSAPDRATWERFDPIAISNNHLISDDDFIRDAVQDVRVGDQIRVRGMLSSYGKAGGGKRGTSTSRTDTGNGACETIYVKDFKILRPARSAWRISMWTSLSVLLIALLLYIRRPYRPYKRD